MSFQERLNEIFDELDLSPTEAAKALGLSKSTVSMWLSGKRKPRRNSPSVARLADVLSVLSRKKGRPASKKELAAELNSLLEEKTRLIPENLKALMEIAKLSSSELAQALRFDPSHISQIRLGKSRPSDPAGFAEDVSRYFVRKLNSPEERLPIAKLIGAGEDQVSDSTALHSLLCDWLLHGSQEHTDYLSQFLVKLDKFDLNDFIRSIRFRDIPPVPAIPDFPKRQVYQGLQPMMAGELDFFRLTASSPSSEPVFMCSNMPMADMARNVEFGKMWMMGLAAALKKGLHFHVIHDLDRPFEEMMLGLESWIPLYMTGQVTPWYMNGARNRVYCHILYTSGAAALAGECIAGKHSHGRYILSTEEEELAYFRQRAEDLLQKALPLMEIFRSDSRDKLLELQERDASARGSRRSILSAPPVYTLSGELLSAILKRAEVSEEESRRILEYASRQRNLTEKHLETGTLFDELPRLSKEEFEKYPPVLSLSDIFLEEDIPYTYEEYSRHIDQTLEYAETHRNYSVELTRHQAFRNIQIRIREGEYVVLSKSQSPTIHFVIRHPKLRTALENMIIPVVE